MTEPIGPRPGGIGVATPPTEVLPPFEDETPGDDNRRKLILVGVGVAVLVVAAALFLFTKGSGTATPTAPVTAGTPAVPAAGASSAPAKAASGSTLPKVDHKPVGRNPFGALVAAAATTTTDGSGTVTSKPFKSASPASPPTSVSVPPAPVTTPTVPAGGNNPGGSSGGNPPPVSAAAPVWIKLDTIQALRSATFTVGYSDGTTRFFAQVPKETTQDPGTFARFFQLQSVQGHYVTVKYGDGTAFDLHAGFRHRHLIH